jgi:hypothetical protein
VPDAEGQAEGQADSLSPATDNSPAASTLQPLQAVDEVFDYASFMWDSGDIWRENIQNSGFGGLRMVGIDPDNHTPDAGRRL